LGRKKRAVVIWVIVLVVIAAIVAILPSGAPAERHVGFPIEVMVLGQPIVTGDLPINKNASVYATDLISDYNNMVDSKEANKSTSFFPLYDSGGSWELSIARDNLSADGEAPGGGKFAVTPGGDWLTFMFVKTIAASSPQITVNTSESAEYLMAATATPTVRQINLTLVTNATPYGIMVSDYATESASGTPYFPFIWITNSSSVYDDPAVNAESAAYSIYSSNHLQMSYVLNPPPLTREWFYHLFNGQDGISADLEVVAILFTIFGVSVLDIPKAMRKLGLINGPNQQAPPPQSQPPPSPRKDSKVLSPAEARRYAKRHPESSKPSSKKEGEDGDEENEEQSSG